MESGRYPIMDEIPITVPVIVLEIPASLTDENTTPYIIIVTAPGSNV